MKCTKEEPGLGWLWGVFLPFSPPCLKSYNLFALTSHSTLPVGAICLFIHFNHKESIHYKISLYSKGETFQPHGWHMLTCRYSQSRFCFKPSFRQPHKDHQSWVFSSARPPPASSPCQETQVTAWMIKRHLEGKKKKCTGLVWAAP